MLERQLLPIVDPHLDTWLNTRLNNALLALFLNPDEHYVVGQDRTGTNPDLSDRNRSWHGNGPDLIAIGWITSSISPIKRMSNHEV